MLVSDIARALPDSPVFGAFEVLTEKSFRFALPCRNRLHRTTSSSAVNFGSYNVVLKTGFVPAYGEDHIAVDAIDRRRHPRCPDVIAGPINGHLVWRETVKCLRVGVAGRREEGEHDSEEKLHGAVVPRAADTLEIPEICPKYTIAVFWPSYADGVRVDSWPISPGVFWIATTIAKESAESAESAESVVIAVIVVLMVQTDRQDPQALTDQHRTRVQLDPRARRARSISRMAPGR